MCVCVGRERDMGAYEPLFTGTCISMETNEYVYRNSLN